MITFIINAGLDDELRRHDWRGFARGYNGSGYEKHNYHGRLAAAYAKWAKIPDTPWKREQALVTTMEAPEMTPSPANIAPDFEVEAPRVIAPQSKFEPSGAVFVGGIAAAFAAIGATVNSFFGEIQSAACKVPLLNQIIESCGG